MPITQANLEPDVRMADLIMGEVLITLTDRASLRTSGAIVDSGDIGGVGTDTSRTPFVNLDPFSTTAAEDTAVAETALTDSSVTLAVVRSALVRNISDLAGITSRGTGDINVAKLARHMVFELEIHWMDVLADVIDGFTATAGATGVDLSVTNIFDAMGTLELADVTGPYWAMLHPQQLVDLRASLRAEGGNIQWRTDVPRMMDMKDQGFVGEFLNVQYFKSSRVNTTGADREGAMWGTGAVHSRTGTPVIRNAGSEVSALSRVLTIELQRDANAALTEIVGHSYFGIGLLEDARGVTISTDA
jgi:hypothetical protein